MPSDPRTRRFRSSRSSPVGLNETIRNPSPAEEHLSGLLCESRISKLVWTLLRCKHSCACFGEGCVGTNQLVAANRDTPICPPPLQQCMATLYMGHLACAICPPSKCYRSLHQSSDRAQGLILKPVATEPLLCRRILAMLHISLSKNFAPVRRALYRSLCSSKYQ